MHSLTTFTRDFYVLPKFKNLLKFQQNKGLGMFLLGTNERVLVEASPVDTIWGVGLAADNKSIENPNLWRGLNLLGFALMEVRERLCFGH